MKVPVRWLRELVNTDIDAEEIAHRLTMAGLEAESITRIGADWDNVYVGLVERVEQHPNADRLKLVTVGAGEHQLTVVTGAPNIVAGQRVPLALVGARLYDGYADEPKLVTLKASTIRGVRSEGMVCSEKELGLSDEHEGIMVLDAEAPLGVPLRDYLGDEVIEFEITPNLVHAFSMIGIARELGALIAEPVSFPELADLAAIPRAEGLVAIEAPDLCPRYVGTVIENVRVEPSPEWMQRRLLAAGVRPISNIVDVTNYVMLEWGQPLHAFDQRFLHEGRIVVRRPRPNEGIETLDHVERELDDNTLVIADADRAVAIAGVMGGVDSEIRDDTTTILLESASFDMANVRRTARGQRLRTEASARFERGIDPNLAWIATQRAVALIQHLLPESRVTELCDVYPVPRLAGSLSMPRSEIERLMGIDYPDEQVLDILSRLDFQPRLTGQGADRTLEVTIPTWRSDIAIKTDIVEEVARIAGYGGLPETLPVGRAAHLEIDPMRRLTQATQDIMVAAGVNEVITYSMINWDDLQALDPDQQTVPGRLGQYAKPELPPVEALNPLRSEWLFMRPTLLPSLLRNVAENLKYSESVSIFEVARVYLPQGLDELPDERRTLDVVLAGRRTQAGLYREARQADFFDAKGIVDELLDRLGARDIAYIVERHPTLHPGRSAAIVVAGERVGILGELHPRVAENFGIGGDGRVAVCEVDLVALEATGLSPVQLRPVSRFQPVEQDFAIVVDESVEASRVAEAISAGAGPLLADLQLFDVYRGPAIPEGTKSLAYRVTLSAPDRALDETEVGRIRSRVERQVSTRVRGALRS